MPENWSMPLYLCRWTELTCLIFNRSLDGHADPFQPAKKNIAEDRKILTP